MKNSLKYCQWITDSRFGRIVAITALLLITLFLPFSSSVIAGGRHPLPPQSHGFGKTLNEWMLSYWTWCLTRPEECLLNAAVPNAEVGLEQVGRVVLLPMPLSDRPLNVTLPPGAPFVTPVLVFYGETHGEDPDDEPFSSEAFTSATVQVFLDGHPLIDNSVDDLGKYYFGPVYFEEPIPLGPENSALWVQGLGFGSPPLAVGRHTLTMFVNIPGEFGFFNTWHLTVQP